MVVLLSNTKNSIHKRSRQHFLIINLKEFEISKSPIKTLYETRQLFQDQPTIKFPHLSTNHKLKSTSSTVYLQFNACPFTFDPIELSDERPREHSWDHLKTATHNRTQYPLHRTLPWGIMGALWAFSWGFRKYLSLFRYQPSDKWILSIKNCDSFSKWDSQVLFSYKTFSFCSNS